MIQSNVRHNPLPVAAGFEAIYAHGVEIAPDSRVLHISGQIGRAADGSVPDGFDAQLRLAIANLLAVLKGAEMSVGDIVKLTYFLTNAEDLATLGAVRRELLAVSPAVTTLIVAGLAAPNLLVEIEAIAARPLD